MDAIALLSDIHGNLPALEAVLADVARRGVQTVVNLGDILSGPLWPAETAALLMQKPWPQLAGNHERQLLTVPRERMNQSDRYARERLDEAALAWLADRPATATLGDVLLCHGTPRSDVVYLCETLSGDAVRLATAGEIEHRLGAVKAAVVACGHSHVPRALRTASGALVVNPGSVGLQAFSDDHVHLHFVENGSPDARYAVIERTGAGWTAALMAVRYDHEAAARQAHRNGRGDWAHALRTGYALRG